MIFYKERYRAQYSVFIFFRLADKEEAFPKNDQYDSLRPISMGDFLMCIQIKEL